MCKIGAVLSPILVYIAKIIAFFINVTNFFEIDTDIFITSIQKYQNNIIYQLIKALDKLREHSSKWAYNLKKKKLPTIILSKLHNLIIFCNFI